MDHLLIELSSPFFILILISIAFSLNSITLSVLFVGFICLELNSFIIIIISFYSFVEFYSNSLIDMYLHELCYFFTWII
jgi:hypothetical protein